MPYVVEVHLSDETITKREVSLEDYGRGLAVRLLNEYTPDVCSRLGEENALIVAPGLFTGAPVPCATRAAVVARDGGDSGISVTSITGDFPQKMASLQIAALVVVGRAKRDEAVLYIDSKKMEIQFWPVLRDKECGDIVELIRSRYGKDCAVIGCGPASDMLLPISGLFTTYPEGMPRFTCPRSSFGDVPASKGLRAVILDHPHYFGAECFDADGLKIEMKKLAEYIIEDPVCGGALPGMGSIALLHLLKDKNSLCGIQESKMNHHKARQESGGKRVNYCCAPMCVIGCLNKHRNDNGHIYSAPEEAEVASAVKQCFEKQIPQKERELLASEVTQKGLALGLNSTEFIYTAALYLEAVQEKATVEVVINLMREVEKGSVIGRLLGGGTVEICRFFADIPSVQGKETKSAVSKESQYHLNMKRLGGGTEGISDLDMLYREIFLFENLGICIFTSFALLNREKTLQVLSELFYYKTGIRTTVEEMLKYSAKCLQFESEMKKKSGRADHLNSIPEFVKVLYRYFEREDTI